MVACGIERTTTIGASGVGREAPFRARLGPLEIDRACMAGAPTLAALLTCQYPPGVYKRGEKW